MDLQKLKFPIGEFNAPLEITGEQIQIWVSEIGAFPKRLKALLENVTVEQLNWKYRPEGWVVKQVVHHCADSHMNSVIRFKLALTEELPNIKPYWEDRWAELADSLSDDISDSLALLTALHKKWVVLLRSLTKEQLKLQFVHPEHGKRFTLDENIGVYAWHCNHHLAHIQQALEAKGRYN